MSLNPESLRLIAREDCETCGATGEQPSDDWRGFEAWADRQGKRGPDRDDADVIESYFLGVLGMESVPPMREECDKCDGAGWTETEIRVDALLELVCEWVEKPLIPRPELDQVIQTLKDSMTSAASMSQGLGDPLDVGSWLRACQEAAEALRAVGELRPHRRDL